MRVRRLAAAMLVTVLASSVLVPVFGGIESAGGSVSSDVDRMLGQAFAVSGLAAVNFPSGINTSSTVWEYPMIARALMLAGGSTDAVLADINGDGRTDLIVGVAGANVVSVFYRESDGLFPSVPSANISLDSVPVRVSVIDAFSVGHPQILVLEKRTSDFDEENLKIYNYTGSAAPFSEFKNVSVYKTAADLVVGQFNGDSYPDVALVCPTLAPASTKGVVEIRFGPDYGTTIQFYAGNGSMSIASGFFNGDSLADLAVANYYDSTVYVFNQPFSFGNPPSSVSYVQGNPTDLSTGRLNADTLDDISVTTENPSAVRFFFQSGSGGLPSGEFTNRSLPFPPSHVSTGRVNSDSLDDLIVLSANKSVACTYLQLSSMPTWPQSPDFLFPTGTRPLAALSGQLDADPANELAIATSRQDWSGSSIAIYDFEDSWLSNSNATAWANELYSASGLASGDIDGNDVSDLVLLHPDLGAFGYMLGDATLGYSAGESMHLLGYIPSEMMLVDLDNDMISEIVVSKKGGPELWTYAWNLSNPGSFDSSRSNCTGNITDIATGDFNNDTLPDIVASTEKGTMEIFYNTGGWPAYVPTPDLIIYEVYITNWTLAVGDFNSDGLDDIAYPYPGCKIGIVLQRTSGPRFPQSPDIILYSAGLVDFRDIWAGDLTGDGKDDISVMHPGDPRMYLFDQNDFTTSYSSYSQLEFPEYPSYVTVTDATDDGKADVLAMFSSADLLFMYNQSRGIPSSTPSMVFVTGGLPTYVAVGDATQDHRADLLVYEAGSHSVSAWEQINYPPRALPGGPYTTRQGDPLRFNGSALAGISELPYIEYNWTFGDGTWSGFSRDPRPTHSYNDLGLYSATLTVRDPDGKTDSAGTTVEVLDSYPHVDFSWSPSSPREGEWVNFTDRTISYDDVVLLNWSVDGMLLSSGTATWFLYQFQDGAHIVGLEALDSDGSRAWTNKTVIVLTYAPELSLIAPTSAFEGEPVTFRIDVDLWNGGPWDDITKYEWDFSYDLVSFISESDTGSVNSTTHQFTSSGYSANFTVAVRVTDTDMDQNITWAVIEVFDRGPMAMFQLSDPAPVEGRAFAFVDVSTSWDGIVSGNWTLVGQGGTTWNFALADPSLASVVLPDGSYTMYLTVNESDGDQSVYHESFEVAEVPPTVALTTVPAGAQFEEYSDVTFEAIVSSYDPVTGYQWDFDAPGDVFQLDRSTTVNTTVWAYAKVGPYTAKVNVTDADGSWVIVLCYVTIVNKPLGGMFDQDVTVHRDPNRTYVLTFDATALASKYQDITRTTWEFGDGTSQSFDGPPTVSVTHQYAPTQDYIVRLTIADDDNQSFVMDKLLRLKQPTIGMSGLASGVVVRSGTPLQFIIGQGSTPLTSVMFSINGEAFQEFSALYTVDTAGWSDGVYSIVVRASDEGGNTAYMQPILITIDDHEPTIDVGDVATSVYGGGKLNITITVEDPNIAPNKVVLYAKFPGDDAFSAFFMEPLGSNQFYFVLEVPSRAGAIDYYLNVTDLAGNSAETEVFSTHVRMHFIDVAWPYMLALALLAAIGTAGYFVREAKIAVDEAFVIYNDGRLIAHSTRRLKPGMDDQVLGSMFVAIQDFVRDSFKDITSFTLRKLEFGEKSVLIEKGEHLFLAVILHGKASRKVARKMALVVDEIEKRFAGVLADWDGDLDALRGAGDIAKKLYSKAPLLSPFCRQNT